MDELRNELASAIFRALYDVEATHMHIEGVNFNEVADAVLAEIAKTHVLVPVDMARWWVECETDCHHYEDAVFNALDAALTR